MIPTIPTQYKLIVGAAALVIATAAGWMVNGWRLNAAHQAEIAARDAQLTAAKDLARLREQDWSTQRNQALDHANSREQVIRSLAAGSASASYGLRDTLAAIRAGVPNASADALGKSVTALSTVLADCSGRYQALAERADRHASDVKTLQDSWPTNDKAQ